MNFKKSQKHLSPFHKSQPSDPAELESPSLYYTCPICSSNVRSAGCVTVQIIKSQINEHLDKCIERQNQMQEASTPVEQQAAVSADASVPPSTTPAAEGPPEASQVTPTDLHTPTKTFREKTNNGAEWKPLAERMRPTTFDQMEVRVVVSLHLGRP